MSAWLDALIGRIFSSGVEIPLTKGINFVGALRATRNPATNIVEADVKDNALTPAMLGSVASGQGVPFVVRVAYTASTPGTADDVTMLTSIAFPIEILRAWTNTTTTIGGSSAQLRTAAAAGGTTLSGTMSSAAAGEALETTSAAGRSVAAGGSVFLRRSDRGTAGVAYMLAVRT